MLAEELERHLKSKQAPVILDVRSGFEFKSGHIPGAIHSPLVRIQKSTATAAQSKSDLLVLVCEHGPRAQLARMLLKWHGYKNLELLNGHMAQWRRSGRLLQKG
jgi:hydroxyacylglutathione hydrolase